ncbi:unnamed protein product [Effrenium voratum]|nr:unnamed protein product [Effrenium voratum]
MAVTAARHGTRGAVACIVCQGLNPRQFLLLKRDGDLLAPRQRFGLPAVRLEAGEAVPVAAARAVEEECSLTADTLRWHPVTWKFREERIVTQDITCFEDDPAEC